MTLVVQEPVKHETGPGIGLLQKIEAIVRPEKVDAIRFALGEVGYPGMTISEAEGHGKQKGLTQQWRGETYRVEFLPKVKVELVVEAADVPELVETIRRAALTGATGDGKIFVTEIRDVVRIRTGERGRRAL